MDRDNLFIGSYLAPTLAAKYWLITVRDNEAPPHSSKVAFVVRALALLSILSDSLESIRTVPL